MKPHTNFFIIISGVGRGETEREFLGTKLRRRRERISSRGSFALRTFKMINFVPQAEKKREIFQAPKKFGVRRTHLALIYKILLHAAAKKGF